MRGLMMDMPLTITSIMQHAATNFPDREIVAVTADDPRHRYTYGEAFDRAAQLANALAACDLEQGDRIATLAWNDHRHLEIYYGVSCSGYVCHTVNPRLFPEQIRYILEHARSRYVFTDPMFVPLLEELAPALPEVRGYVVLTDDAHMPASTLPGACSYEAFIAGQSQCYEWPALDEQQACSLCYTSGTTGNPKGVLYSHRSTVLHAYAAALPDVMNLHATEVVLPVVPMFHVNAWGVPYAVPMTGGKLVLPGALAGDPATLLELIRTEEVTYGLGVSTVWHMLVNHARDAGVTLAPMNRVVCGGAAMPESLFLAFAELGVDAQHGWGMTEMSPLGSYNAPTGSTQQLPAAEQHAVRLKQGRAFYGVELKIVDDDGNELPRDGAAFGRLLVRGPWVASAYFGATESPAHRPDGWFDTGDVATIDRHGFMQIVDRTKDVIKSGGEWISSIELENTAMAHPAVAEAAALGMHHPKWGERPLLVVVTKPGATPDRDDLLAFFNGKVARWSIPDDVVFVDALPKTATGKISKKDLRDQLRD